jgi:hypothetical protein
MSRTTGVRGMGSADADVEQAAGDPSLAADCRMNVAACCVTYYGRLPMTSAGSSTTFDSDPGYYSGTIGMRAPTTLALSVLTIVPSVASNWSIVFLPAKRSPFSPTSTVALTRLTPVS